MAKRVMILSGAGLSAESGLRTFRDSDGLWEEYDVMEVCSIQGFQNDREKVLAFYDKRRTQLSEVAPNAAHTMIAQLWREFGESVRVITQNVDDLLERAGCGSVLHLHGFLPEVYCEICGRVEYIGYEALSNRICNHCNKAGMNQNGTKESMRHNIVMFGEHAPHYATLACELESLRAENGLLVCIGTSGEVINVAQFTQYATKSILNNLEPTYHLDPHFDECFIEPATTAAPKIATIVREFMRG